MNKHQFLKKRINGSFANNPSQPFIFSSSSSTTLKSRHISSKKSLSIHISRKATTPLSFTTIATHITTIVNTASFKKTSTIQTSPTLITSLSQKNNDLPSGTIVGITFSIVCAIALVIFIYFFFTIRKERKLQKQKHNAMSKQSFLDTVMTQNNLPSSAVISPSSHSTNNHVILENEKSFTTNTPTKTYAVISAYNQTLDDELYIQPGDKVQIFNEYDDGWCLGKNLTRGGTRGVLPLNCLGKLEILE